MNRTLSFLLFLLPLLAANGFCQLPRPAAPAPTKGRFYVDVDDGARIFVNGNLVHNAGIDTSVSSDFELKAGDRIVAQLNNSGGGRWFKLVFLAADQKSIISFKKSNFRILDDVTLVDFTPAEWGKWNKPAKSGSNDRDRLPIKNTADHMWGDKDACSLGCLVTADLFKPRAAPAQAAQMPAVLTVEAFVDGPSTLHVRTNGLFWMNGQNAKPGLLKMPTYVNDTEWTPKWGNPNAERGFDRSDVFPITLESLEVTVELVSNMTERGVDLIDRSRTPIQTKKVSGEIEVAIPDPESGQRWYKIVFRGRKK